MNYTYGKKGIVLQWFIIVSIIAVSSAYTASAQALLQVGTQPPDFSLRNMEGKKTGLSDFSKKKAVVVLFWSTWSANSRRALKLFEEFHRKYKDRDIQIISVNADNQTISGDDEEKIRKVVSDLGISFPVLFDSGLSTFRAYNTIALPSTIVISQGKISYELPGLPLVGTDEMFDYLLTLAGEQPRKKTPPKYQPRHDAIADTNLARGFLRKKMNAMAYPLFKKAIEKDPGYMLPYVELAKLYELDGDTASAEDTLRRALSVEAENVAVMTELGRIISKAGRIKDALPILEKAAGLNSYTPSHYYLAFVLGKNGQSNEAFRAFETALSLNPFEPVIYLLRAEIYEDNKMLKEASADYKKALQLMLKIRD